MKLYIIRAIKQFLFYATLATLIVSIMILLDATDIKSHKELFVSQQWSQMILLLAALSAVYPAFGYGKKVVNINARDNKDKIINVLSLNRYKLENENDNSLTFRGNIGKRLRWLGEDKIEISILNDEQIEISGPRKEIILLTLRIHSAISNM